MDATRSPSRLLAFLGLVSILVPLTSHEADARTWLVRKSGKGLIFAKIQDAVDVSADGDTVDIGPGSFNERVSVVDKTLLIRGAGREQTEIDGYPHGNVFALRGFENYTEIRGLTIVNGWADVRADVNGGVYGGGVLGDGAVFALVDCRITHCFALSLGGAVYGTSERIIPDGGGAPLLPRSIPRRSAGIDHDVITIRDCRFDDVIAGAEGGAFCFEYAYFVVENCVIEGGYAAEGGGGRVFNSVGSVTGCLFRNNVAEFDGGAIETDQNIPFNETSIRIAQNTFVENGAGRDGAAALIPNGATIDYERNIFARNGGSAGTVIACRLTDAEYHGLCNLFWSNAASSLYGECIAAATDTTADPLFCNPDASDFHVCEVSPALTSACGARGAYGSGCPQSACLTVTRPVTWSAVKSLFRPGSRSNR